MNVAINPHTNAQAPVPAIVLPLKIFGLCVKYSPHKEAKGSPNDSTASDSYAI